MMYFKPFLRPTFLLMRQSHTPVMENHVALRVLRLPPRRVEGSQLRRGIHGARSARPNYASSDAASLRHAGRAPAQTRHLCDTQDVEGFLQFCSSAARRIIILCAVLLIHPATNPRFLHITPLILHPIHLPSSKQHIDLFHFSPTLPMYIR